MTRGQRRTALSLAEVLIVIAIVAVLAVIVAPQLTGGAKDAKFNTAKFDLHLLRSQIQLYRSHHDGLVPGGTLTELLASTDADGAEGTGPNSPYGPYLREIPFNAISNSKAVKVISNDPARAADVTGSGGWLYNASTGGIWIDNSALYAN